MGDGQKVALRLQASSYYKTYSLSFSEPWFGGKKPIHLALHLLLANNTALTIKRKELTNQNTLTLYHYL